MMAQTDFSLRVVSPGGVAPDQHTLLVARLQLLFDHFQEEFNCVIEFTIVLLAIHHRLTSELADLCA